MAEAVRQTELASAKLDGITELDLSGIDFINITDLAPLYVMDDLTDLWLVGTQNLDAFALDALLDNLATIEGTDVEGILHMTQADYDAFNTAGSGLLAAWHFEHGHHVENVLLGDFNHDGICDGADFLAWQHDPKVGSLADWQADYGKEAGPITGVPEPATILLMLVGIIIAAWLKRSACRIQATR